MDSVDMDQPPVVTPGTMVIPQEMQWNIHPDIDEGEGFRCSLMIGERTIFEGPTTDDPRTAYDEALSVWMHCLEWSLLHSIPTYHGSSNEVDIGESDDDDEDDEDDALKGYVWVASWAEDLKEQDEVLLLMGPGQRVRGIITRIHRSKPEEDAFSAVTYVGYRDETIDLIWTCTDEKECMGHHYGMSPRSPVWIGTMTTPVPDDIEEIPDDDDAQYPEQ